MDDGVGIRDPSGEPTCRPANVTTEPRRALAMRRRLQLVLAVVVQACPDLFPPEFEVAHIVELITGNEVLDHS